MSQNDSFLISSKTTTATGRVPLSTAPKILIAEDSADSREVMQLLLETKGYQVIAADDGLHAIELALSSHPDLILLDLELPRLDGLSVTRELRLYPVLRGVPIVIVSGHDPGRYRRAAIDAGCDEYLLKPINFDGLQQFLDRFVHRGRAAVKSA